LNVAVGFSALCLLVFTEAPLLRRFENIGIDWLIRMHVGTARPTQHDVRYVYLDIDEETYRRWDEPWFTPRDKILELIRFARRGGARIVVVDLDLSKEADLALGEHLESYDCDDTGVPDILLSASMRYPSLPGDPERPVRRQSFLDAAVAGSCKLHWASPIFIKDSDETVRRWQLFAQGHDDDLLPSHQFLSVALLEDPTRYESVLAEISKRYDGLRRGDDPAPVRLGELEITLEDESIPQRIVYAIPWSGSGKRVASTVRDSGGVTVIPAHLITETTGELDASALDGKVVVIGASHRESGDLHRTPLGVMPGSLIIVNSIHSLLSAGQINPPAWWWRILIATVPLVVVSVASEKVRKRVVRKSLTWVLVVLIVPASFVFFHYGIWMDFFIPMILVELVGSVRTAREVKQIVRGAGGLIRKA
jgi:CHASE2 domain-containing sensor protein